jgi:hypothetical protein
MIIVPTTATTIELIFQLLSDKNACNAIEEMIAYYKSGVMEHIIQPIKD